MDFFRNTFARAGAFAYLGEAAAHVWVLTHRHTFLLRNLPLWADAYFFILGGYCMIGLWLYSRRIRIKRCRSCFVFWITTLHLTVSVLLHTYILLFDHAHKILSPKLFPWWYSFIGFAYCIFFAWYLVLGLKLLPEEDAE